MSDISRRAFITAAGAAAAGVGCPAFPAYGSPRRVPPAKPVLPRFDEQLIDHYHLNLSARFKQVLRERVARKQYALSLVWSLPDAGGEHACNHAGWPVATATTTPHGGQRFIVSANRAAGHGGTCVDKRPYHGHYMLWSEDLETWQVPRLTPPGHSKGKGWLARTSGMRALGVQDGKIYLVSDADNGPESRVLMTWISADGSDWSQSPAEIAEIGSAIAPHCGPNLIPHPRLGLVGAVGQETNGGSSAFIFSRQPGATSWRVSPWTNKSRSRVVEPALACSPSGALLMVGREYNSSFASSGGGRFAMTQCYLDATAEGSAQSLNFETKTTNITAAGPADLAGLCHDTAEVLYNPVLRRFECIQSQRFSTGLSSTQGTNSMNLWSISEEELRGGANVWKFRGVLLERNEVSWRGSCDGMHPGGSVVRNGWQYVFFYAGFRDHRGSSVFLLARDLSQSEYV